MTILLSTVGMAPDRRDGDAVVKEAATGWQLSVPPRAVLRNGVAAIIRKGILEGGLPPGTPLIEAQIARQMGISRGPLREALRMLEHEGLVVSFEHRGTFVRRLSDSDIEEIYSLRASLERFAIRRTFEVGDVPGLAKDIAKRIERMAAMVASGDVRAAEDEDFELHEAIVRASGHSLLLRVWETMLGQFRLSLMELHRHPGYQGFQGLAERHRPILIALQKEDVDSAEAAVHEHVVGHGNALLLQLRQRVSCSQRSPSPSG